jgi:AcrR family transcriptional regulator
MSTTRTPNPTNPTNPARSTKTPTGTPTSSGKSAAETRKRILSVAANLFAHKGYANTTVRDIAAGLGISNPSLYHHFPSKADILLELIAEPLACVERAVVAAMQLEGEARTRCIVGGLLDAIESHRTELRYLREPLLQIILGILQHPIVQPNS